MDQCRRGSLVCGHLSVHLIRGEPGPGHRVTDAPLSSRDTEPSLPMAAMPRSQANPTRRSG
jgi:hypothetical protein